MSTALEALKAAAPQSEQGNFYVKDSIGVPHPYCIGAAHVAHAADHFDGMLGKEAIESAERKHITSCQICKGKLTFAQHETAVLIGCKVAIKDADKVNSELQQYLLKLKTLIEGKGDFVGFAFEDERKS